MNYKIITLSIIVCFISSCNKSVSRDKYNSGWNQAVGEGCACNSNLTQMDNSEEAKAGIGWADGYVDGCNNIKKGKNCS